MIELMMTAVGKAGFDGKLTGAVTRSAVLSGDFVAATTPHYILVGNRLFYSVGGKLPDGTNNQNIWVLNLDTFENKVFAQDPVVGSSYRCLAASADHSRLFIYGGAASGGTLDVILDANTGAQLITPRAGATLMNGTLQIQASLGNKVFRIGGLNDLTVVEMDMDTGVTFTWTAKLRAVGNAKGFWAYQVGDQLYGSPRGDSVGFTIDLTKRTIGYVNRGSLGGAWSDPAPDSLGGWSLSQGNETEKFTTLQRIAMNGQRASVTLKGAVPTEAAYSGKDIKFFWYKDALYFFRSDLNTSEGKTLFRIV